MVGLALGVILPVALLVRADEDAGPGPPSSPGSSSPSSPASSDPTGTGTTGWTPAPGTITLTAASGVDRLARLPLTGTYAAPPGTVLRVQLLLPPDTWVDLPVPAAVDGSGRFATYVELDRRGTNQLRVHDPLTGRTSGVLSVSVR